MRNSIRIIHCLFFNTPINSYLNPRLNQSKSKSCIFLNILICYTFSRSHLVQTYTEKVGKPIQTELQ